MKCWWCWLFLWSIPVAFFGAIIAARLYLPPTVCEGTSIYDIHCRAR